MGRPEKFQAFRILIQKQKQFRLMLILERYLLADMARRTLTPYILKMAIFLTVFVMTLQPPAYADTLYIGSPIDTNIYTEPIPNSQKDIIGEIDIKWTGLEYGYQRDLWIMKGMIVNGTDSDLILPIKYGQVDLILLRDDTPLSTDEWCGTLDFLKKFSMAVMPPRSIYRFSIPGETGRKYSVVLETRDIDIKSDEMIIDRWSDGVGPFVRIQVDTSVIKVGYTKTSGIRFKTKIR